MRKIMIFAILGVFTLGLMVSAERSVAPIKQSKYRINKIEPETIYGQEGNGVTPIANYNNRDNSLNASLVDSSMNGYGLLVGSTFPLVKNDNGYFATYRQWCGASCTSGQIGASYSSNGTNWTTYTNLNPIGGTGPDGDGGIGRYPSSLGNDDYPFSFWNEYTGTGAPSYGGRPFYSFDEFGWDGGSFSDAIDIDMLWDPGKDLWVGTPALSNDGGMDMFNIAYADWTRSDVYLFHSEAYADGFVIFGEEILVIDETAHLVGGDDEGSYTSSPVMDINEDGVGYVSVSAYYTGADVGSSPYSNSHTAIFTGTTDHGQTWSGSTDGAPYYHIGDDVYQHMFDNGVFPSSYTDPYDGTLYEFTELFCSYDFHMRVDSDGDPHFIMGVLPGGDGYVYPGIYESNGFYHFTIDKDHLSSPGEPQTSTGWNYSKVVRTDTSWMWDIGGWAAWQFFFPHLSFSEEDEDVMYVVSSLVTPGEEDIDGTYPEWTIDLYVSKSEDGGATWWCPYRATDTTPIPYDDWICPDGLTLDSRDEHAGHAGSGATDDMVPVLYNYPDYCYGSTTGDAAPPDFKNRIYIGNVSLDSEPQCGDCPCAGDANGDMSVDVLDIVSIVNVILGNPPPTFFDCSGDQNSDGSVDVLDIVSIVNCILAGGCDCDGSMPREGASIIENATSAQVFQEGKTVSVYGDGFIGGIQMTLKHSENFDITLKNEFSNSEVGFGAYNTVGNTTTLVIVAPANNALFTAEGDFEITEIVAASGDYYLDITIANKYALLSNYPNPFNPETQIRYELLSDSFVELSIYNINGQLMNSLVSADLEAGVYNAIWDGADNKGAEVASGVYLMQLKTNNEVITNKITLLR